MAFAPSGEQVKGSVDAASEEIAERTLWDWQYKVVLIHPVKARPTLDQLIPSLFGVKPREVINFSRHLATLVESGIALLPAIELLQGQSKGPFARVLGEISRDLKNGSPFSTAVAQHHTIFPPIYSRLMEVGERTGSLETVLRRVASHIEKEQAILKRVRGAMAYPAFILVLAAVVVGILVTTALPPLDESLRRVQHDAPPADAAAHRREQVLGGVQDTHACGVCGDHGSCRLVRAAAVGTPPARLSVRQAAVDRRHQRPEQRVAFQPDDGDAPASGAPSFRHHGAGAANDAEPDHPRRAAPPCARS